MMPTLDEKVLLEVIEEILGSNYFEELSELDENLAMGIIAIVEDGIRLYHSKNLNNFINEMEKDHLTKL